MLNLFDLTKDDGVVTERECESSPDIELEVARSLDVQGHYTWYEGTEEMRLPMEKGCYEAHGSSVLGREREGLLVDCGAIDNLAGQNFVERQGRLAQLSIGKKSKYVQMERPST